MKEIILFYIKNKSLFKVLACLSIVILTTSCSMDNNSKKLLSQAQSCVQQNPELALMYLDSISNPSNMKKDLHMQYVITKVQAKYKTMKSISEDYDIFDARDYFENKNNYKLRSLAQLYSGCVYEEQKNENEAFKNYLNAEESALKTTDDTIKGLINYKIGELYYKRSIVDSATVYYKESMHYYDKANATSIYPLKQELINCIAKSYTSENQIDSALVYNIEGLHIAEQLKDTFYIFTFSLNIGIIHQYQGNNIDAKKYILKASKTDIFPYDRPRMYLNLSRVYYGLNQRDSANYYAGLTSQHLPKEGNAYMLANTYNYLSQLKEDNKEYSDALFYNKLYSKQLIKIQQDEQRLAFLEIAKNHTITQKEKTISKIQLQAYLYLATGLLILALLVTTLLIIKITRNRHKHEKQINASLNNQVKNMLYLNNVYKNIAESSASFEKELETLSINYGVKEKSEGYKQIQKLLKNMKKDSQDGLLAMTSDFLLSQFDNRDEIIQQLTTADLLFLSLTKCGYEFKDIAKILGITPHALQMRKQRLKMKLKELNILENILK